MPDDRLKSARHHRAASRPSRQLRDVNQKLLLSALRERDRAESARRTVLASAAELKRLLDRERFLARVGVVLASSLDYRVTLQQLARRTVPKLADWCEIMLVDGGSREQAALASAGPRAALPSARARQAALEQVLRSGETALVEPAPAGRRLSLLCVPLRVRRGILGAILLLSRTGFPPDAVELFEEIADRAAMAVDNARLLRDTQLASRMRDELLAIVSHDLGTPLAAIRFSSVALQSSVDQGLLPPAMRRSLDTIRLSEEQLHAMIQELAVVASVHGGRLQLRRAEVDLGDLVDDAFRILEGVARERSVRLRRRGKQSVLLSCDRARILRVLTNLVHNSLKFCPAGTSVNVSFQRSAGEVLLKVQDQGPGIPRARLSRLFEAYSPGRKSGVSGLGLGLYIAKGVVVAHGGSLRAESRPGEGSTFFVSLPVAAPG